MNDLYARLLRPLLFRLSPETAHDLANRSLTAARLTKLPLAWLKKYCGVDHPALVTTCAGLAFRNPIGLAAGFDKNAEFAELWPAFGFAFVELGTVTMQAQTGNPAPRLFRLPKDRALINRMGFNNIGADLFKLQFLSLRARGLPPGIVYGVNIGKSKATPLNRASEEYEQLARIFSPLADYLAVNVSSPNTPGLRTLQAEQELDTVLTAVKRGNTHNRPVFVKIAPDLSDTEIAPIVELVMNKGATGMIATNTTLSREGLSPSPHLREEGGVSGAPLKQRSTVIIRSIYKQSGGKIPVIGVGGIETAEDAYDKILAGASLVQLYTGFIYGGPFVVKAINQRLITLLKRDGFTSIRQAIGQKV